MADDTDGGDYGGARQKSLETYMKAEDTYYKLSGGGFRMKGPCSGYPTVGMIRNRHLATARSPPKSRGLYQDV